MFRFPVLSIVTNNVTKFPQARVSVGVDICVYRKVHSIIIYFSYFFPTLQIKRERETLPKTPRGGRHGTIGFSLLLSLRGYSSGAIQSRRREGGRQQQRRAIHVGSIFFVNSLDILLTPPSMIFSERRGGAAAKF
jgi:hypothetical protein